MHVRIKSFPYSQVSRRGVIQVNLREVPLAGVHTSGSRYGHAPPVEGVVPPNKCGTFVQSYAHMVVMIPSIGSLLFHPGGRPQGQETS